MITDDDFLIIDSYLKQFERKVFSASDNAINVETIDLDENFSEKSSIMIDSSFVSGVVGPMIYIYSRAAGIGKDIYISRDFFITYNHFFVADTKYGKTTVEVSKVAEIAGKSLEYKIARDYLSDHDYVVIDGSLYADAILYSQEYLFEDPEVQTRYEGFRKRFEDATTQGVLSVAKRIVQASFLDPAHSTSDVVILLRKFPRESFYTKIYTTRTNEGFEVKFMYFRPRPSDKIYRLEAVNLSDDEILNFVKQYILKKSKYPFGLEMAHNRCKIKNSERLLVEGYIKKALGYNITQ